MTEFTDAFDLLDAFIPQWMEARHIPGLALALTDRRETLRIATYGFADLAARTPVEPNTLFEIGSIGKSFTAIALLQEHEAGRLDLHAPVTTYLPWFSVPSSYPPITIHHLLSHTAGIARGADVTPDSRSEVWALRSTRTAWAPGERFHYSNTGYKALGLVLRAITGTSYGETIRNNILEPLGMTSTEPIISHDTRRRLATGYVSFYDDRPAQADDPLVPATWLETDTADGCIASTAGDMAAYLRMLLNAGQTPQKRILSAEGFGLLTGKIIAVDRDSGLWYGYGMFHRDENGHMIVGHGGGMVGYCSNITADLDAGYGVAALINGPGEPTEVTGYARRLLRAAESGDFPDPPDLAPRENAPNTVRDAGTDFEVPAAWSAYPGHYRSFSPWVSNFRVISRKDRLMVIFPPWERETALDPIGPNLFQLHDQPEYLQFGPIVDGQAITATFSGGEYYRVDL